MRFKNCLHLLLLFITGLLFAQIPASAEQSQYQLLTAEGTVQVFPVGASNWTAAQTNQALRVGDKLRTGVRSRATVRMSDLTVLRVNELTTMQIRPPAQPGKQSMLDV